MSAFSNRNSEVIMIAVAQKVQENKVYLSELDGLIGDGDHGVNMNKGFSVFEKRMTGANSTFTEALNTLGTILITEIGGSMGPIYGTIFIDMADAGEEIEEIDEAAFGEMLKAGYEGLCDIVEAKVGDKTIVDVLEPAVVAYLGAVNEGAEFPIALLKMKEAAEKGRESTRDLVARFGRSSRLGERSRGVLDAGAVSCCLILETMADEILKRV